MRSLHWCYCFDHHQSCIVQVWNARLNEQLTLVLTSHLLPILQCAGVDCQAACAADFRAHDNHSQSTLHCAVAESKIARTAYNRVLHNQSRTVQVWNARLYEQLGKHIGHIAPVTCLALDGNFLISGSEDCTVRLWDLVPASRCQISHNKMHI